MSSSDSSSNTINTLSGETGETLQPESKPCGELLQTSDFRLLFGNRHTSEAALQDIFKTKTGDTRKLRQVHSSLIIESAEPSTSASSPRSDSPPKVRFGEESTHDISADGHWTSEIGPVLSIVTADCVPVLVYHAHRVLAVHAGWRGLVGGIVDRAGELVRSWASSNAGLASTSAPLVFIGPHIRKESFEIGADVVHHFRSYIQGLGADEERFLFPKAKQKFLVDLTALTQAAVHAWGLPSRVWVSSNNTFNNSDYHSYRQSGTEAGRQRSYIQLCR